VVSRRHRSVISIATRSSRRQAGHDSAFAAKAMVANATGGVHPIDGGYYILGQKHDRW
jgi:hypothetical protein